MKDNFQTALAHVLKHEGGKVDHPHDPGGRTNQGITQKTYTTYRKRHRHATRDVFSMTTDERDDIYKTGYWDRIGGDELPIGVDYCAFDLAVNSGPLKAQRFLKLAPKNTPDETIHYICDERLKFLRNLKTWQHFGKGWSRRVSECRNTALAMAKWPQHLV